MLCNFISGIFISLFVILFIQFFVIFFQGKQNISVIWEAENNFDKVSLSCVHILCADWFHPFHVFFKLKNRVNFSGKQLCKVSFKSLQLFNSIAFMPKKIYLGLSSINFFIKADFPQPPSPWITKVFWDLSFNSCNSLDRLIWNILSFFWIR